MPKFYVSDYTKRKRAEKAEAEKAERYELRQLAAVDTAKALAIAKQKQEAKRKKDLETYNSKRISDGKAARKEITMYQDEGFAYSKHLAKQRVTNRIEILEMDSVHYAKEIQKFKDKEWDTGHLVDTLSSIKNELSELQIDLEVGSD